jgi:nucleotide-binding universal stress UspA family protein
MHSILYSTDYSPASVAALHGAQMLSYTLKMRLILTHVYDVPSALGTQLQGPFPDLRKDSLTRHRNALEAFYNENRNPDFSPSEIRIEPVENMSVLSGILSVANEWHAKIIAVGMKGENPLKNIVLGSTTKKLIDKSPCPVLAVPSHHKFEKIAHIVYATDFELEDLHALEKVAELAHSFNADLRVIHITDNRELYGPDQMAWFKAMLKERIKSDALYFELLEANNIADILKDYAEKLGADMICMLERSNRNLVKKWFHRDIVKQVADQNNIPLLSFNEQNLQTYFF